MNYIIIILWFLVTIGLPFIIYLYIDNKIDWIEKYHQDLMNGRIKNNDFKEGDGWPLDVGMN